MLSWSCIKDNQIDRERKKITSDSWIGKKDVKERSEANEREDDDDDAEDYITYGSITRPMASYDDVDSNRTGITWMVNVYDVFVLIVHCATLRYISVDKKIPTSWEKVFSISKPIWEILFRQLIRSFWTPMGGRLSSPPSSASSSSATAHRNPISSSTTNLAQPRTHSNSNNHPFPAHRHRSSSGHHHHHHHHHHRHHHSQATHAGASNHQSRQRTGSTHIEPLGTTPLNLNLLRYVGLDRESDDQSSDEDSPRTHRRIPQFFIALRDVTCPVCNKTIPHDTFEKHILQCLAKPRIAYNGQSRVRLCRRCCVKRGLCTLSRWCSDGR